MDLGLTQRRAVLLLYGISMLFTAAALALYIGRSLFIGGALLALTVSVIAIVRFAGYFKTLTDRHSQVAEPFAAKLRKGIPAALTRIQNARSAEDLEEILERLATDEGLLAVAFVAGEGEQARELPRRGHRKFARSRLRKVRDRRRRGSGERDPILLGCA